MIEQGDKRKDCCRQQENLGSVETFAKDLTFRRCRVCRCRHFEAIVDPLRMNFTGAPVAGR